MLGYRDMAGIGHHGNLDPTIPAGFQVHPVGDDAQLLNESKLARPRYCTPAQSPAGEDDHAAVFDAGIPFVIAVMQVEIERDVGELRRQRCRDLYPVLFRAPPRGGAYEHSHDRGLAAHSALMPAALMTLSHTAASACMKAANCCGESPTKSTPWLDSFCWTSLSLVMRAISALSLATMSFGVFAGSSSPNHEVTSKPLRPASDTVGMAGSWGERFKLVTAMPFSLPVCTWG